MNTIITTSIYLLMFVPTLLFCNLSEKYIEKKKSLAIFCGALSIIIPSFFAGYRGLNVGVDIKTYAYNIYSIASESTDIISCLTKTSNYGLERVETGYVVMAFIATRLINDIKFFLFITEFMIILPIFSVAIILRKRISPTAIMATFLFVFYISTFNIMRQSIAAAWLLLAVVLFKVRRKFWSFIFSAMSICFHRTSIILLPIILIIYYLKQENNKKSKSVVLLGMLFLLGAVIINSSDLIVQLMDSQLIDKYKNIIVAFFSSDVKTYRSLTIQAYGEIITHVVFGLIGIYIFIKKKDPINFKNFLCTLGFLSLLTYLSFVILFNSVYGYRLTWQLDFFLVLIFPTIYNRPHKNKTYSNNIVFWTINFSCLFLGYAYLGWHGTLPLTFNI